MAIHVTSSNIKSFPLHPMHAVRQRIDEAAQFPGINFGQELHPAGPRGIQESEAWRNIMHAHGKVTYGSGHEVPISIPDKSWEVRSATTLKLTNSVSGEHAPSRFITVVEAIKRTNDKTGGIPVAFVNMHPEQKPHKNAVHHRLWENYISQAKTIVQHKLALGYNVVYGGDMNIRGPITMLTTSVSPRAKQMYAVGLDHLFIAPAMDWNADVIKTWRVAPNANMDHSIISVRFNLSRRV